MTPKRKTPRPRGDRNRKVQRLLKERQAEADQYEQPGWARVACLNHIGPWLDECPNCVVAQSDTG